MAAQKGTVQRAKASGIGSLSNSQGMTILGSVLYQTVRTSRLSLINIERSVDMSL